MEKDILLVIKNFNILIQIYIYILDRDGKYFSFILNYLRDGEIDLPINKLTCKRLLREAKFYGIKVSYI